MEGRITAARVHRQRSPERFHLQSSERKCNMSSSSNGTPYDEKLARRSEALQRSIDSLNRRLRKLATDMRGATRENTCKGCGVKWESRRKQGAPPKWCNRCRESRTNWRVYTATYKAKQARLEQEAWASVGKGDQGE